MPMTSPVERISGPSRVSTPGNRLKGSTASLTETWPVTGSRSSPSSRSSASVAPTITRAATMATGTPVALATNGHRAAGPRVGLEHVGPIVLDRELHVDQPPDLEGLGDGPHRALELGHHRGGQGLGRQGAGRVARVDAGLLHVLHHPADRPPRRWRRARRPRPPRPRPRGTGRPAPGGPAVTPPSRPSEPPDAGHGLDRLHQPLVVVDDLHGPAAEHVGRAGPAPGSRSTTATVDRLGRRGGRAPRGLGDAQAARTARSTARGPRPGRWRPARCPSTSSSGMPAASLSGVWPPRLTMTPTSRPSPTEARLLGVEHVGQVLGGERLEVEPVRGVVVGRDRLGVAVDHHRLVAGRPQGERGVDAAVVELDALADPVGPRAEDDHPGPVRRAAPRPRPRWSSSGTGVWASNSAPQVSTVLKVTPTPRAVRAARMSSAVTGSPNR